MSWFNRRKEKDESKPKQDYATLFEQLAKDGSKDLVWLLLGSLISADTLLSVESCENSISMLTNLSEAIDRVPKGLYTPEEIESIKDHCTNGIEICRTDLEELKKNEKADKEDNIL